LVELHILYDRADSQRVSTRLRVEIWVITSVEGDGYLGPLQVLRGSRVDCHDLSVRELLLPFGLIEVGTTIDVVDLFASLQEVVLRFIYLLLLVGLLG
jgi:hypothetical protein